MHGRVVDCLITLLFVVVLVGTAFIIHDLFLFTLFLAFYSTIAIVVALRWRVNQSPHNTPKFYR